MTADGVPVFTFGLVEETTGWPRSWRSRYSLAIVGGLCLQTGLLLASFEHPLVAGGLVLGSSMAFVQLFSIYADLSRRQTHAQMARWGASVVLTTAYLLLLQASHGFGSFGIALGRHSATRAVRSEEHNRASYKASSRSFDFRDAYAGIILWPKKQTFTKLIAPAPILFAQKFINRNRDNPLTIPFDGVYWFYRAPDPEPPPKSRQAQGSPELFDINSTDVRPLSMEARQNLGTSIDLSCCSRIQIVVRNSDRFGPSVSLELVVTDTTSPGRPSQSLGRVLVNSDPMRKFQEHISPISEVLNFALPSHATIARFDEMTIVFHLEGYRARNAAKMGIDHFTLVPRGS